MTPGLSRLAPVRKEAHLIGEGAPTDVVDGLAQNARVSKLKRDERREVAVWFTTATPHHRTAARSAFQLERNVFADLKRPETNVWADCDYELAGVMRESKESPWDNARHRPSPPGVDRSDVATRRMGDQDRNAVRRTRSDSDAFRSRNERIALAVRDGLLCIGRGDLTNGLAVHLSLLEQAIRTQPDQSSETHAVLPHRPVIIAQVKTEVERVVR